MKCERCPWIAAQLHARLVVEVQEEPLVANQDRLGTGSGHPGHDGPAVDVERAPEVFAAFRQLVAVLEGRTVVVVLTTWKEFWPCTINTLRPELLYSKKVVWKDWVFAERADARWGKTDGTYFCWT